MKTIDLHVHSCCSDGSFTPEELVALAQSAGLSAFALTDHDTTDGIGQALLAAEGSGLEVVPGIEFSTRWLHRDIHILGYYIDYRAQSFQETLHGFLAARDVRNRQMCERIREQTGIPITVETLSGYFPDAVITRAHMAAWLADMDYVETRAVAFDKYLGEHAPCFVPKTQVTPEDAIRLIRSHGGIPVLAHPLLYALSKKQLRQLVGSLKESGLKGIEAVYVLNRGSDEAFVRSLAEQYGLLVTGGSDFHGKNKPHIALGTGIKQSLAVPYELLEELKAAGGIGR
ncbi:MAG: PHP domain-containing protein [Lachnospiraceae bacterium]